MFGFMILLLRKWQLACWRPAVCDNDHEDDDDDDDDFFGYHVYCSGPRMTVDNSVLQ